MATNVLNIVYYNARSLLPKLDDLHLIAESVSPDMLFVLLKPGYVVIFQTLRLLFKAT